MIYKPKKLLRVSQHCIDEHDKKAVMDVMDSGTIARGARVREFEDKICEVTGAKYAVACSSGTAALHLAMMTEKSEAGPYVEISAITFIASVNAALQAGAREIHPLEGGYIDVVEADVYIPMHYAGHSMIPSHVTISNAVEDACHAFGGHYEGTQTKVGSVNTTCFSFHPTKNITTGEGGAVTTNDVDIACRLDNLRDNGREHGAVLYPGLNYHMSEMNAALGISQLSKLNQFLEVKRSLCEVYWNNLPDQVKPVLKPWNVRYDAPSIFPVEIDFENLPHTKEEVQEVLLAQNIETSVHYMPIHLHPVLGGQRGDLPEAEAYWDRTLTLPLHVGLDDVDVRYICDKLGEALK